MLLFAGDWYYPCGPSRDFLSVIDSVECLSDYTEQLKRHDWYEILDNEGNLVEEGETRKWLENQKTK